MDIDNLLEHFDTFWHRMPYGLKIRNDSRMLKSFQKKLAVFSGTEEIFITLLSFLRKQNGLAFKDELVRIIL